MHCIIRNKHGHYFTGMRADRQGWTPDITKARVFARRTDALISNAFKWNGNAATEPKVIPVDLVLPPGEV